MTSYVDWNRALAEHVVTGLPRGSAVYLSVDDDMLERIGHEVFGGTGAGSWGSYFRASVRGRTVENGRITLRDVETPDAAGLPGGVAFLGATVLAANDMGDAEEIDQADYFRRLRHVFGLPVTEHGRPPGLIVGAEAPLWEAWNAWLLRRGFIPTAREGEGPKRYISYPISQSLLRRVDKDSLVRLFSRNRWRSDWGAETLAAKVCREEHTVTSHLRGMLSAAGTRYEALAEAMLDLYEEWREQGIAVGSSASPRKRSRVLHADLYRTIDPFLVGAEYYVYPRQPRGWLPNEVRVEHEGRSWPLVEHRPGHYAPLFPIETDVLNDGARYPLQCDGPLDTLLFPKRDFWILIPEPDNPESGVCVSRSNPSLGTTFIVLCRGEVLRQLQELREERLIVWQGEPVPLGDGHDWVEVRGCIVVSGSLSGYFGKPDLYDAIRPHTSVALGLSGGLRSPMPGAWLDGAEPSLTVFAFQPTADLHVTRIGSDRSVFKGSVQTGEPMALAWPGPGDYLVDANSGVEEAQRLVKIMSWDDVRATTVSAPQSIRIGDWNISGASIHRAEADGAVD
jgi:hypothetical protein